MSPAFADFFVLADMLPNNDRVHMCHTTDDRATGSRYGPAHCMHGNTCLHNIRQVAAKTTHSIYW